MSWSEETPSSTLTRSRSSGGPAAQSASTRSARISSSSVVSSTITTSISSPRAIRFGIEQSPTPIDVATVSIGSWIASSSSGFSFRNAAVNVPEVATRTCACAALASSVAATSAATGPASALAYFTARL